jgi:hypothetical protein
MSTHPPHAGEWPLCLSGQFGALQNLRSQLANAEASWNIAVERSGWDRALLEETIEDILHGWMPPDAPSGELVPGKRYWPGTHPITPGGKP